MLAGGGPAIDVPAARGGLRGLLALQAAAARRQLRSAVLVAVILGILSLVAGARSWRERRYLDAEILAGFLDSLLTLGLAHALSRGSRVAAWLLLGLVGLGALYSLAWMGFPLLSVLPQAVAAVLYVRAIMALGFLRAHGEGPG